MSHSNTIHGYIHTWRKEEDFNRQVLASFPFDEEWSLPNIFCQPEHQGNAITVMICFALSFYGSAYAETSDWDEWQEGFERLLSSLHVYEANVEWDQEIFGSIRVYYQCQETWDQNGYQPPGQNRWVRVTTRSHAGQEPGELSEQMVF